MTLSRRQVLVGGLAAAPFATTRIARAADTIPIRYASVGGTTDAGIYIAKDYGFFKDAGIDFSYRRLTSASALLAAVATDQLDVAGVSLTPGLFTSIQQGINLRVVGDKESILPHFSTQLVARTSLVGDTTAQTLHNLRGRTVSVSGRTSASFFLFAALLKKYGLSLEDVKIVELAYANTLPALTNGAIDAAVELEPYLSNILGTGAVKAVSDFVEALPPRASIVPVVYSEKLVANRKAGEAFMIAYMKAVRVYNDAFLKGTDKDRVIDIVAKQTNFDPEVIRRSNPVGFEPNQEVNPVFLDEVQRFYLEQRFIPSAADVKTLVDPSFAAAAVRALGRYS
jgi:NitT/TauT family transport system substrate-binding protein